MSNPVLDLGGGKYSASHHVTCPSCHSGLWATCEIDTNAATKLEQALPPEPRIARIVASFELEPGK